MTTPTVTPLAPGRFLATCRTLRNHVIIMDGETVAFCGTDREQAAHIADGIADERLTVEHTTGADCRNR